MDKQRQEEIIQVLKEKDAIQRCPRCTNPQFELIGEANIPVGEERDTWLAKHTPTIPVIVLACKNCGYISYHATRILDLRPPLMA